MKQLLSILSAWMVAAGLSCCTDDLNIGNNANIKEGVPVVLSLKLDVGQSAEVSRAASSGEEIVQDLYIFSFTTDGDQAERRYYTSSQLKGQTVQFPTTSGTRRIYAVANLVSGSGSLTVDDLNKVTNEASLKSITSRLANPVNIGRTYFLMSGQLLADDGSKEIQINEQAGVANISGNATIQLRRVDARITFKVKAETTNSNFKNFTFTPDRYWVENIPGGTNLFELPADYEGSYGSMEDANRTIPFEGQDENKYNIFEFYIPENRKVARKKITEIGDTGAENLYALRERCEKTPAEADPTMPGKTEENGAFEYAPAKATYVVFHGLLSYDYEENGVTKFVNADVTYTVHLGNTGEVSNANNAGTDDAETIRNKDVVCVNNYNTRRNTHYTYTVTITGIESMTVEVKEDTEQRPGVEGDVIIAGAQVKNMDSHYGRALLTLRRADIKNGLAWAISTPFQKGMRVFNAADHEDANGAKTENLPADKLSKLQTTLDLNDYKWVQFVINREAKRRAGSGSVVDIDMFAKYPGYEAYDGGSGTTSPAPAFGGKGYHYAGGNGGYYSDDVTMYDVNQLINHLYVEAHNPQSQLFTDADGKVVTNVDDLNSIVTFTAYIDEYVYKYDPRETYYEIPDAVTDESKLRLWKDVVNGTKRMLHLCTSQNIYSPDGNTSLAESVITISQAPVYTFYDNNNSDINTAWGTESIMETDPLPVTGASVGTTYTNSLSNGRSNTLNVISGNNASLAWSEFMYMESDHYGELQKDYNNIWYACLGRNRDLNGNDVVDANEVRWYLASIDQLTDLWIGQGSLNSEAWLYHGNGTKYAHVASSSYYSENSPGATKNSPSSPWVIWAEEGASRGSYDGDYGSVHYNGENYEYRCVRNLGLSLANINAIPEDYVVPSSGTYTNSNNETYNEYILDLSKIEANSLRQSSVNTVLLEHNEREGDQNKPFKKFAVLRGLRGTYNQNLLFTKDDETSRNRTDLHYYLEKLYDSNPCPAGYRVPNQRELMLMYTTLNEDNAGYSMDWDEAYLTCTQFSYNGIGLYTAGNRYGFMYNGGNLILETGDSHPGQVRCVRDVTE